MSATVSQITGGVDGDLLMAHCAEFAKRVKLSGTPEELESFRYLQRCLDGYGCRTELLFHDAYISLPGAARVDALGRELTCITHSFSLNSPAGGLKAPLVDLGGGSETEFAASDCKGKIGLVNGIASPAVAARAKAAGAVGLLHVSHHQYVHEMCISPVWGNPSGATIEAMPTAVVCTVAAADGAALREALAKSATMTITLHAVVDTGWRQTPLLVAHIDAAAGEDAPFVLMSGHHDTWYYGVMDNGSANATMLEAARLLAAQKSKLRRNVRICFWSGHSHGRYSGSTWYADLNWRDLDRRCAAHVNVDSTGGVGATVCGENGVVAALAGLARDATQAEAKQKHLGKRPSRSSDQSFWGIGIPSMYGSISHQAAGQEKMRHALGWWWHTPEDLLDKIDRDFLVRDTRIVLHTMWRLTTDPVLPIDPREQLASLAEQLAAIKPLDADFLAPVEAALSKARSAFDVLGGSQPDEVAACGRRDAALMRACRALVPLDYTRGDRFDHDAALPQNAWPSLDALRALAAAPSGSDDTRFALVAATRARNRLLSALEDAEAAAKAG
jgi:hypothetical protein